MGYKSSKGRARNVVLNGKPFFISNERAWNIEKNFGLSVEAFVALVEAQDGKCAICSRLFAFEYRSGDYAIDHDHRTGVVRGVLCGLCNKGLGHFGDNPELLKKALAYLDEARSKRLQSESAGMGV